MMERARKTKLVYMCAQTIANKRVLLNKYIHTPTYEHILHTTNAHIRRLQSTSALKLCKRNSSRDRQNVAGAEETLWDKKRNKCVFARLSSSRLVNMCV